MLVMSSPATVIVPESALSKPQISFRVTLFPVPLRPNKTYPHPVSTLKEMPFNTVRSANDLETPLNSIAGLALAWLILRPPEIRKR